MTVTQQESINAVTPIWSLECSHRNLQDAADLFGQQYWQERRNVTRVGSRGCFSVRGGFRTYHVQFNGSVAEVRIIGGATTFIEGSSK